MNCPCRTDFIASLCTGGDLVVHHWNLSYGDALSPSSRWMHRIIAIVEAVPILGYIVASVELLLKEYFFNKVPFDTKEVQSRAESTLIEIMTTQNYLYSLPREFHLPTSSNAIDTLSAKKWIYAHPKRMQNFATRFVDAIEHVSFSEFFQRLELSVRSFNTYLSRQTEKRYVIVVSGRDDTSSPWVTTMAVSYFVSKPINILHISNLRKFQKDNPGIKQYVFIDDASYSGLQMKESIAAISSENRAFIVVPFVTNHARRLFEEDKAWVSKHQVMKTMGDLASSGHFTQHEISLLNKRFYVSDTHRKTLTYFDHKVADSVSTMPQVLARGETLHSSRRCVPFVPETVPPYKPLVEEEEDDDDFIGIAAAAGDLLLK